MNVQRRFAAWPFTKAIKVILIVNGSVWLTMVLLVNWFEFIWLFERMAITPDEVIGDLALWQPLTYMWVHSPVDLWHILLNSLFLWMFGGVLELNWGTPGFIRFYLICGVGAGLVVLLTGMIFDPETKVVGASGAIYGLVVAWAITFPNRRIYFFGLIPIRGLYFALIPIVFALADFLMRGSGVSHAAHLGGMAIGALLVTGYWRPRKLANRIRYWYLRRKIRVVEDATKRKPPPDGGYWH
jgi:membrane associated rhomboid family serine protease